MEELQYETNKSCWYRFKRRIIKAIQSLESVGIFEIVDFLKDLYYAISYQHKSWFINVMLWFTLLYTIVYTILKISFMTAKEYVDEFGRNDFLNLGKCCCLNCRKNKDPQIQDIDLKASIKIK